MGLASTHCDGVKVVLSVVVCIGTCTEVGVCAIGRIPAHVAVDAVAMARHLVHRQGVGTGTTRLSNRSSRRCRPEEAVLDAFPGGAGVHRVRICVAV